MRRRRVEVEPVLLGVLAVVPLASRQAEDPLLQDGVLLVPEREGQAQPLLAVADATEPVLVPAIGPRPACRRCAPSMTSITMASTRLRDDSSRPSLTSLELRAT